LNSAHVETRPHSTQRQVDQKILSQTLWLSIIQMS
jgi:hypothetical protein